MEFRKETLAPNLTIKRVFTFKVRCLLLSQETKKRVFNWRVFHQAAELSRPFFEIGKTEEFSAVNKANLAKYFGSRRGCSTAIRLNSSQPTLLPHGGRREFPQQIWGCSFFLLEQKKLKWVLIFVDELFLSHNPVHFFCFSLTRTGKGGLANGVKC